MSHAVFPAEQEMAQNLWNSIVQVWMLRMYTCTGSGGTQSMLERAVMVRNPAGAGWRKQSYTGLYHRLCSKKKKKTSDFISELIITLPSDVENLLLSRFVVGQRARRRHKQASVGTSSWNDVILTQKLMGCMCNPADKPTNRAEQHKLSAYVNCVGLKSRTDAKKFVEFRLRLRYSHKDYAYCTIYCSL